MPEQANTIIEAELLQKENAEWVEKYTNKSVAELERQIERMTNLMDSTSVTEAKKKLFASRIKLANAMCIANKKTSISSNLRLSMLCFMTLTFVQILVFLLHPVLVYGDAAVAMDRPPHFVFFRLIGVKEIGLMIMYSAAVPLHGTGAEPFFCLLASAGRLSTPIFMTWIVAGLGGPPIAYCGIIQDVVFGAWTLNACINTAKTAAPAETFQTSLATLIETAVVATAGAAEAWHGWSVMLEPAEACLSKFGEVQTDDLDAWSVGPLHLGWVLFLPSFVSHTQHNYYSSINAHAMCLRLTLVYMV